jgi:RND superfamily putative drug exporter
MDYAVFLLARVRELHDRGLDTRQAVVSAVGDTGGVIAGGAVIMCIVFGGFATADLSSIRTIGLGLAVAVVLDVTVARLALVPAAMRLLGRWNWWFPRVKYQIEPGIPLSGEHPTQ